MVQIKVPDLGDGIDKVEIALWHKNVGDQVGQDEDVVELVTDKASFNVMASVGGVIRNIYVKEGKRDDVRGRRLFYHYRRSAG